MSFLHDHLPYLSDPLLARHFVAGKNDSIEQWSVERVTAYQLSAVNELLEYVEQRSALYREKMSGMRMGRLTDVRELDRYPFTTREELASAGWGAVTEERKLLAEVFVSTGTTGGPEVFIAHSYEDLFARDLAPAMPLLVPLLETDLVVNALPYEMSSAGLAFHRVFVHGTGAAVFAAGKDGCYSDPSSAWRLIGSLGANALITSPSYAIRMSEAAVHATDGGRGPLRLMWLTGEPCSNALRRRLEHAWRCPAYFYYGSLECGGIGIECTEQDGYHLASGHVYVEIVGQHDRVLAPGEIGELVVTVLLRRGTPLIRYRTGDLGYIEDYPCACGITLPRVVLRGRRSDQIRVGGRVVSPVWIEEMLLRSADVDPWYTIHDRGDDVIIDAVIADGWRGRQCELAERLESRLEYLLGGRVAIRFVSHIDANRGKARRVQRGGRSR